MILIEDIEYYQVISGELEYKGKARIRQELIRPLIEFKNSQGISLKLGWGNDHFKRRSIELRVNPYSKWSIYFTEKELLYLSTKYNFSMVLKKGYDGIYHGLLLDVHEKYDTCGTLIYLEQDNTSYIAIVFKRWQFSNQPRSAGEDAMGEDVTYIHGIWENPELPESIIKKIKS